jgi:hypothetical protein
MPKHPLFVALTICSVSFIYSCKEIGPDINLHGNVNSVSDTTYIESPVATPEAKNVLIEEFTGVQCANCPQGHIVESGIEATYAPGRVAGIALHPNNPLCFPYPFSLQDLRNTPSTNIYIYLGNLGTEPCADIDRQLFPNQSSIEMDRSYWAGFVAQEIALTPQVNIELSDIYNASNHQVTVVAKLHYTQNISQPNNITIALTEDSVVTAQLNGPITIDTFYVHNNVLRTILTGTTGDNVAYNNNVTLVAGRVVQLVYQDSISTKWNPQHMSVVAFVHEHATSQVVYQAKKISLTN